MRNDILERKPEIEQWVHDKLPKAEIARRLSINPKTLNVYLKEMSIEYSGNQGSRGCVKSTDTFRSTYMTFSEYVNRDGVKPNTNKIRIKLIREGLKESKCECCGNDTWLGKPIPLEVHHVDGDNTNNDLNNLQILCPNCHALTDNYRGKNIGK